MSFWKRVANSLNSVWGLPLSLPSYTKVPAVAPPITHKVETKWTPISHNGELRTTCGFVPPTPGYAPCTREPHSEGPCAHTISADTFINNVETQFAETDAIAQRLHREYRATSKALKGAANHDHGWKHCRQKRYFWNRARQWRRDNEQRRLKDSYGLRGVCEAMSYIITACPRGVLPQDEGSMFEILVFAPRRRDALAKFRRCFPDFIYTEITKVKF